MPKRRRKPSTDEGRQRPGLSELQNGDEARADRRGPVCLSVLLARIYGAEGLTAARRAQRGRWERRLPRPASFRLSPAPSLMIGSRSKSFRPGGTLRDVLVVLVNDFLDNEEG